MAYAKYNLRYKAFEKFSGWFPRNLVILEYKGLRLRAEDFQKVAAEKQIALASGREWIV